MVEQRVDDEVQEGIDMISHEPLLSIASSASESSNSLVLRATLAGRVGTWTKKFRRVKIWLMQIFLQEIIFGISFIREIKIRAKKNVLSGNLMLVSVNITYCYLVGDIKGTIPPINLTRVFRTHTRCAVDILLLNMSVCVSRCKVQNIYIYSIYT